ncbi:28S rRNA (cytosine-C(5))-methyltransferase-like [Panonychus citri]|uniref:28S rRNA (cytosine-C(5))-methyltransferase-like n=1 Tax=Panonychus citri TaxID=50023 RepID=UPI002307B31D|nr:28S rRNA (cytosine-C(5))-methyltransferase-like [Panonychus citri]XP_053210731.1 28S rRNA (cytosine-C(5))-methyltransferase-like [Panonychus citri]
MTTDLTTIETKYREAALILKRIDTKKLSLKKCISNLSDSLSPLEKKAIYALAINAEKNKESINKMKKFCIDESQQALDPYLLSVLLGKLIFERKVALYSLPQGIAETDFIVEHRRKLASMKARQQETQTHIYLRINKLKTQIEEIIPVLLCNGFNHNETKSDCFETFVTNCHALKMRSFMRDFHFQDELLVFRPAATKYLTCLDIYKSGKIIIQDKASLLAVKAMGLQENMNILDVCCAPGTKTAAMAACMKNEGQIVSIDRDSNRLGEMKVLLDRLGVKCCKTVHGDFIEIASQYLGEDIDVLLLDPSCSGTGRPEMSRDQVDTHRIGKLAGFQTLMLKTAFTLGAKKLLYSTCSVDMFENEVVISTAMNESPEAANYQIVDPMPDWPMRSESTFPFADKVIRSDKTLLTRGFFFCLFERIKANVKSKGKKRKNKI